MLIRILIADDHTLFREGIRRYLSLESDLKVVGEAGSAAQAVEGSRALRPDVVLLDVAMTGQKSFGACREIKKDLPQTKVMFLTMHADEEYFTEALDSGASGYLLKDAPGPQLLQAVRDVAKGGNALSPRMTQRLVESFRPAGRAVERTSRPGSLTPRERSILKMLAEGTSVKDIASGLDLSVKTVEAHKFNMMRKLDIHNRAQLVHYAIQKNIIKITAA